jgi:hypothetical protein
VANAGGAFIGGAFIGGGFGLVGLSWAPSRRTLMALRIENRVAGGDANPCLAIAAMLAAGIHSMDRNLALVEALVGDDYAATGKASFPKSLQEARKLFADSEIALEAFGEEVVGHYLNMARVEVCSCGISKPSTGRPSWTLRRYSPVGGERRDRPRKPIPGRAWRSAPLAGTGDAHPLGNAGIDLDPQ